jgi:hypothetical protein
VVNGIVYGLPVQAVNVLIYNPSTNQLSSSSTIPPDIETGNHQYLGGWW